LADDGGFEELRRLGARSVPVVSRDDRFVFAQVIRDVVEFLGLGEKTSPVLSPAELHARYDHVLETIRLVRQMPVDKLEIRLPNRPRSWRMVMHHIFQIPTAYLDMEEEGGTLSRERLGVLPPPEMRTSAAIADFGEGVRARLNAGGRMSRMKTSAVRCRPISARRHATRCSNALFGTRPSTPAKSPRCSNKPASRPTARSGLTTSAACR